MPELKYGPADQATTRAIFETDREGNPIGRTTSLSDNDPVTPFNTIYYGEAPPGTASNESSWAIRKFTYDANGVMTSMKWAGGSRSFKNVWDQRATYQYS